jgi:hypothetical protein
VLLPYKLFLIKLVLRIDFTSKLRLFLFLFVDSGR